MSLFSKDIKCRAPGKIRVVSGLQASPTGPTAAFATLVSTKSTGSVSGSARSTTGYIKVEWWDSTTNVYGTGVAGSYISWSKAAGGAGSKTIKIFPSDANGWLDGALTHINCDNNSLTSLDVSGLTALTQLYCHDNSLTSLDVSGLTALTNLECYTNQITSLNLSGLTALESLVCYSNSLTSLDVSGLTSLTTLECGDNSLTSLGGFLHRLAADDDQRSPPPEARSNTRTATTSIKLLQ